MIIDERYNDNVVFNKAGLQQLLDNIKTYPIINAEYLSDGGTLTENSPCVRITFGDSQSEAGFLTYALNFRPEEGYSQADYDALLANKKQYDGQLKEVQKNYDKYNRIYIELCAFYTIKANEIKNFLTRYTDTNWSDYEQLLKDLQTILNNDYIVADPNDRVPKYFDGENSIEAAIRYYQESGGSFIYDLTTASYPVSELFTKDIELLTPDEESYLTTKGEVILFKDYPEYKKQQLKTPLDYYCDQLHRYVLANEEDSKIIEYKNNNNVTCTDIYNILFGDNWGNTGFKELQEYLYTNRTAVEALEENLKDEDSNNKEWACLSAIIRLTSLSKAIEYYYQKWIDQETPITEEETATLNALLTNIYNYIKNNLYSYVQCTEDDLSSLNFLEIYSKNNNTYIKIEDKSNITQANIENYYKLTCGELYQKILRAKAGLDNSQTAINDINANIIETENNLNSFNTWAKNRIDDVLKPVLLGHAYLPVGSNITFYEAGTNTELTPCDIEEDQPTGTFRVKINSDTYEVPINGLVGGNGQDLELGGSLIPSQDNQFDIGKIFTLATEYDENDTYYIEINGEYQIADPQPNDAEEFELGTYYILAQRRWKSIYLAGENDGVLGTTNTGEIPPAWTAQENIAASISTEGGIRAAKNIWGKRVFNAVFNDYAECRTTIDLEPGRVVIDQDDGSLACATRRLQPGAQVISDTYGHLMGGTETAKTPIAVAGRVLVYPYKGRSGFHAGMAVCSAPGGTVDIMTRQEIKEYPDCIVGIVSEIPNYERWGSDQVEVNGRIWIKVK